ncbi:MAG: hypothetical protein WEE89_01585 [Gemmatimonadota bacterium]
MSNDQRQEHALTAYERELLLRMLAREFRGRDELLSQLRNARVKWVETSGSPGILIAVSDAAPKAFVERTPLDAQLLGHDSDGMRIRFILHVIKGSVAEIEIFREDGEPINELPSVAELQNAYPSA